MIIPVTENMPWIFLWMDWKLYQYQGLFIAYAFWITLFYFVPDKKYRVPYPYYAIIGMVIFFTIILIKDGVALG